MTRLLGLMLAVLLGLAACGDAGDDGTAETVRRHPAVQTSGSGATPARRALIRVDDLPVGWQEEPGTIARIRCRAVAPFRGASAVVSSLRMTHDRDGVQERIAVFPSTAAARAGLSRLNSRAAARCLRSAVRRYVSDETNAPASPATLVRVDRLGPSAAARRYISTSISSLGKVIAYIDAVHMRVGPVVGALTLASGPRPPDVEHYEHVVNIALRRLRAAGG